jgi:hypothetical protein
MKFAVQLKEFCKCRSQWPRRAWVCGRSLAGIEGLNPAGGMGVSLSLAQVSELSFPVVFHTENWAGHSGNPTVSSVYLPTPRWHFLKTLSSRNSFSRWASHDIFLSKYHFLLHILRFLFFFSDNIMADVASKQQTTALFLSTIVTRTRSDTELTRKLINMMWNLCCAREHSVQFFYSFSVQLNCAV